VGHVWCWGALFQFLPCSGALFQFLPCSVLSFNFCHVRCSLWIECLPCLNVCENQISITEKLKAVQSVLNLIHYHEYASIFRFKNLKRALKNALEV
jgi:hypothetical protein